MTDTKYDVLGIGNAIVDVIATASDDFVAGEGLTKGRMQLIDTDRAEELYARMNAGIEASGGSVANSMAGIASLGGRAAFIGKVADDELGKIYAHDMKAVGVHFATPPVFDAELPTGRSLILVTPDGERTMNTYLGAAGLLRSDDIDARLVESSKVIYLEGYRFDLPGTKAAFYRAAQLAKDSQRKVAVTLSDKFCVEGHRQHFIDLVNNYTDILFANDEEIQALYETDFSTACEILRDKIEIACITRGPAGSVIVSGDQTIAIKAEPIDKVVDTTGAGDLYAAGFLYGYTRGLPLAECGRIASLAAAEVIGHYGPRPEVKLAELIKAA
jgi:sugar/nucleoside kinase (ribokinase family)